MNRLDFIQELTVFFTELGRPFRILPEGFLFEERQMLIHPVRADDFVSSAQDDPALLFRNDCERLDRFREKKRKVIFLWEDVWMAKNDLVKHKLKGEITGFTRIHGRLCRLLPLTAEAADGFFTAYHLLGAATAKYRYGLFYQERLIAAASFSSMRSMIRDGVPVCSAEWVRYASLPGMAVTGGMGKLLSAFIAEHHPGDIMSYADMDWSEGKAYVSMGFRLTEIRPVQEYWLDPQSLIRYPGKRYPAPKPGWKKVYGLGSRKYIYTVIP